MRGLLGLAILAVGCSAPEDTVFVDGDLTLMMEKVAKRSDEIRKGLPDALDLLVICAEAGLTVDAAFTRVARELGADGDRVRDRLAFCFRFLI